MGAAALASVAVVLSSCGGSGGSPKRARAGVGTDATHLVSNPPGKHPHGVRADCSMRSEARFPGAFADPRNVVIGPLVLVGGAESTSPSEIHRLGGQKFPLLLKAGHTATVQVVGSARTFAGLGYIPRSYGGRTLRDSNQTITFVSCRTNETSGSSADGAPVTFWAGFVVATTPICVPLDIYVDRQPSPRRAALSLGALCRH